MELWENVILTGYLLWGSWYDIRKRAVPVGVLFLGGVLAVMVIVWKGFECRTTSRNSAVAFVKGNKGNR